MKERFGATNPRSLMLRFHTQTAGVQLTAQQPEVNLVRVAVQALAAVLGGTQSLHTNAFDEAIALPTPKSARLALRTQQVLAYETDVTKTVDPFAGSYAVESLTDDLEEAVRTLMAAVEDRGGAVEAIEQGFQKGEIERAAYQVAGRWTAGSGWWSGSTDTCWRPRTRTSPFGSTRPSRRRRPSGWPGCGPNATAPRFARPWSRCGRRLAAPPTSWCR